MKKNFLLLLLTIIILCIPSTTEGKQSYVIKSDLIKVKTKYKKIKTPKVSITTEEVELESGLKDEYLAYKYHIKNESKQELYILSGQFEAGVNGGDAYLMTRKNADTRLRETVWEHDQYGPIGWAYDFIRSPFVWFYHINRNKKMKKESLLYCKDKFFQSAFSPNDFIEKLILFPIDREPYLRITLKEPSKGYLFTVIKQGFDKPEKPQKESL